MIKLLGTSVAAKQLRQVPRSSKPDEPFGDIPWRSSDAAIGVAALMPWLALNSIAVESFAKVWLGGGLLIYEALFIAIWTRMAIRQRRGWGAILLGIGIAAPWIAFGLCGPVLLQFPAYWWTFYVYQSALLVGVPYWLARGRWERGFLPDVRFRAIGREVLYAIPVLIGIFLLIYASNYFWRLAGYGSGMRWRAWMNAAEVGGVGAMFTLMVLSFTLVPIAEEVFFRGFLFNALRRSVSFAVGMGIQALFFAAMHPSGFVGLLVLALILAGVYHWRKTILAPIVVHAGHNLFFAGYFSWVLLVHVYTPIFGIHGSDGERIVVTYVRPQATADLAGLRAGDTIVRFNGYPVQDMRVLHSHVMSVRVGQTVPVDILRDGQPQTIQVTMHNRFFTTRKN